MQDTPSWRKPPAWAVAAENARKVAAKAKVSVANLRRAQISPLRKSVAELQQELIGEAAKVAELEKQLEEKVMLSTEDAKKIAVARVQWASLRQSLETEQEKLREAKQEAATERAALQAAMRALEAELNGAHEVLRKAVEEKHLTQAEADDQLVALQTQVDDVKKAAEDVSAELAKMRESMDEKEKEVRKLTGDANELQKRMEAAEAALAEAKEQTTAALAEAAVARREAVEARAKAAEEHDVVEKAALEDGIASAETQQPFDDDVAVIIIDTGSSMTKAGFRDNYEPRAFPTVIARPNILHLRKLTKDFDYLQQEEEFLRKHGFRRSDHYKLLEPNRKLLEDANELRELLLTGNTLGAAFDWETSSLSLCGHAVLEEEVQGRRELWSYKYAIENGIVTDWDTMEGVWHRIFHDELRVAPKEHPVLLTEPPLNLKANREKMAQVMFETFNVPALCIADPAVLAALAAGCSTGVVLCSGDELTTVTPIFEGQPIVHATVRVERGFAGKDLTDWMAKLLIERGLHVAAHNFMSPGTLYPHPTGNPRTTRDIKEKLSYVALNFDEECQAAAQPTTCQKSYSLPHGGKVTIGSERFRCPEALFRPSLLGLHENDGLLGKGVDEHVYDAIMKCPSELHSKLFSNVLLSGGNTMFKGFAERLSKELTARAPAAMQVRVIAPRGREHSVWTGGCMLSSRSTWIGSSTRRMWILKQDYDEMGPSIVHLFDNRSIEQESPRWQTLRSSEATPAPQDGSSLSFTGREVLGSRRDLMRAIVGEDQIR